MCICARVCISFSYLYESEFMLFRFPNTSLYPAFVRPAVCLVLVSLHHTVVLDLQIRNLQRGMGRTCRSRSQVAANDARGKSSENEACVRSRVVRSEGSIPRRQETRLRGRAFPASSEKTRERERERGTEP